MVTISLSRAAVQKQKGMVVLPIKEYQRLLAAAIPTYYLTGKAALKLDKLVHDGIQDYKAGKTRVLRSLADLD